jgi:hypothetical protein
VVIAAHSAVFVQAFARIGLIPDAGGTYWLPRQVSFARAMSAVLFAEPSSAERAVLAKGIAVERSLFMSLMVTPELLPASPTAAISWPSTTRGNAPRGGCRPTRTSRRLR